jgi:hypothetical protein
MMGTLNQNKSAELLALLGEKMSRKVDGVRQAVGRSRGIATRLAWARIHSESCMKQSIGHVRRFLPNGVI